jgi:hypothetical protein
MDAPVKPPYLQVIVLGGHALLIIDVRRRPAFGAASEIIAPQASGLAALSLGLSRLFGDDHGVSDLPVSRRVRRPLWVH